eukprot:7059173-Lingulodinium_polyedra.AAC.1
MGSLAAAGSTGAAAKMRLQVGATRAGVATSLAKKSTASSKVAAWRSLCRAQSAPGTAVATTSPTAHTTTAA